MSEPRTGASRGGGGNFLTGSKDDVQNYCRRLVGAFAGLCVPYYKGGFVNEARMRMNASFFAVPYRTLLAALCC